MADIQRVKEMLPSGLSPQLKSRLSQKHFTQPAASPMSEYEEETLGTKGTRLEKTTQEVFSVSLVRSAVMNTGAVGRRWRFHRKSLIGSWLCRTRKIHPLGCEEAV